MNKIAIYNIQRIYTCKKYHLANYIEHNEINNEIFINDKMEKGINEMHPSIDNLNAFLN